MNNSSTQTLSKHRIAMLESLMAKIGYTFNDYQLLNTALTHSSFAKGESRLVIHNERLEFLGDAVLELCISEYLYQNHPTMNEGMMTRTRSRAVYEPALFSAATDITLGEYLLLSYGEENTGGRKKPSILSDALEALIGAIYLDGGLDKAKCFVLSFARNSISSALSSVSSKDYKTLLQETVQRYHLGELEYEVIAVSGPDHKKVFTIRVSINNVRYGIGDGNTKQEAGQNAAKATLEALRREKQESKK